MKKTKKLVHEKKTYSVIVRKMAPLTPQRKRLTNEEKIKIIEDSNKEFNKWKKTLLKNKMEESSKQTKITDAFSVKQIILK